MSNILIGTSGYDYPEWKGVFYPLDLKRKDFLSYYSTQFNALEINNTFYSMPTSERLLSFYERSEGKVNFSIKAHQSLTHQILPDWKESSEILKQALSPLLNKGVLGSVLFQFPQSFHYIPDNRIYLGNLINEFKDFPVVIEFRHQEWIRESVFEGLVKRNSSIVFCDMPQLKALPNSEYENSLYTQFVGPQAYIRLHGRNKDAWYVNDSSNNGSSRYDYEYSEPELKAFVTVIKVASQEGKKINVFFNNHPKGSGAKNALQLKELLNLS